MYHQTWFANVITEPATRVSHGEKNLFGTFLFFLSDQTLMSRVHQFFSLTPCFKLFFGSAIENSPRNMSFFLNRFIFSIFLVGRSDFDHSSRGLDVVVPKFKSQVS